MILYLSYLYMDNDYFIIFKKENDTFIEINKFYLENV